MDCATGDGQKTGDVAIGELELLVETVDDCHALFGSKTGQWTVEVVFGKQPYPNLDYVGGRFVPPPIADFQCVIHKTYHFGLRCINEWEQKMFHLGRNFVCLLYYIYYKRQTGV